MGFMLPEIEHGLWLEIETRNGTEFLPADLAGVDGLEKAGDRIDRDDHDEETWDCLIHPLHDYLECSGTEDVCSVALTEGWGARLSAPGYLDCTQWSVYPTEREAREALAEECDV